ncbi:MAG: ribonuclease P protein component [Deltaproteobacteria bacterium]|nr:ribonuclease P protein component [Deltaproteobacteria bacterium]
MDIPSKPKKKSHGFSKRQRLLKPGEFSRVFKAGKRLTTRNFLVYVLKHGRNEPGGRAEDEPAMNRLGVSVSSASGNAVARNRIKRLMREFFRLKRDAIFPDITADIVIAVKKSAKAADIKDYTGVKEELGILYGKAW